jgi:hypothetical protein
MTGMSRNSRAADVRTQRPKCGRYAVSSDIASEVRTGRRERRTGCPRSGRPVRTSGADVRGADTRGGSSGRRVRNAGRAVGNSGQGVRNRGRDVRGPAKPGGSSGRPVRNAGRDVGRSGQGVRNPGRRVRTCAGLARTSEMASASSDASSAHWPPRNSSPYMR